MSLGFERGDAEGVFSHKRHRHDVVFAPLVVRRGVLTGEVDVGACGRRVCDLGGVCDPPCVVRVCVGVGHGLAGLPAEARVGTAFMNIAQCQ